MIFWVKHWKVSQFLFLFFFSTSLVWKLNVNGRGKGDGRKYRLEYKTYSTREKREREIPKKSHRQEKLGKTETFKRTFLKVKRAVVIKRGRERKREGGREREREKKRKKERKRNGQLERARERHTHTHARIPTRHSCLWFLITLLNIWIW